MKNIKRMKKRESRKTKLAHMEHLFRVSKRGWSFNCDGIVILGRGSSEMNERERENEVSCDFLKIPSRR